MRRLFAGLSVLALLVAGCGTDDGSGTTGLPRTCVSDYEQGKDYFPDKVTVDYATNFTLDFQSDYAVLTIKQPYPGGAPATYVVSACGTPEPELTGPLAGAQVIDGPVQKVFSGSTTQLPWFTELGVLDALTGVADGSLVSNDQVRARIDDGSVVQYGTGGNIDTERVLADKPDVLLTDGTQNDAYPAIERAGIPVIGVADYLETSPLGTAEWIKVLGVLTGRADQAQKVFAGIADRYNRLAQRTRDLPDVDILYGADFQGTWSVPGEQSVSGQVIRDAGGDWPWSDRPGSSVQTSWENILAEGAAMPIWLVADNAWTTIADVEKADPRYANLQAVSSGQVWNANLKMGPTGGNDFYESGTARPDLVLADTVAILHPELLPDHEFTYYRQLKR